jgi:hypothetical protein
MNIRSLTQVSTIAVLAALSLATSAQAGVMTTAADMDIAPVVCRATA